MPLTAMQVKGRIKNLAKQNNADARVLMRIYMMERFLERVAASRYSGNFIIKGGILVTSMVGISMRSTMDIDTTLNNINLSEEDAFRIVDEISKITIEDDISFRIKEVLRIMDEMDYPGIRVTMDAVMDRVVTPIKIDISTGDAITPGAIEYSYKLMLEDRCINLWSYNIETILAEKLQTILDRGSLNTRMRDFYDVKMLLAGYANQINSNVLKKAFYATCKKRGSLQLEDQGEWIINNIADDEVLKKLWSSYQKKYNYAENITYKDVIDAVSSLFKSVIFE